MNSNEQDRSRLQKQLDALNFALLETQLFLDSNPDNRRALRYFEQCREAREKLVAQYEAAYGPLTARGNGKGGGWQWVMTPWPWEMED